MKGADTSLRPLSYAYFHFKNEVARAQCARAEKRGQGVANQSLCAQRAAHKLPLCGIPFTAGDSSPTNLLHYGAKRLYPTTVAPHGHNMT